MLTVDGSHLAMLSSWNRRSSNPYWTCYITLLNMMAVLHVTSRAAYSQMTRNRNQARSIHWGDRHKPMHRLRSANSLIIYRVQSYVRCVFIFLVCQSRRQNHFSARDQLEIFNQDLADGVVVFMGRPLGVGGSPASTLQLLRFWFKPWLNFSPQLCYQGLFGFARKGDSQSQHTRLSR